jgi:predicted small metal-binding protein
MTMILHCRDAGFDCGATVRGESTQEILDQVRPHAAQVHHVEVDGSMAKQLEGLIVEA